MTYSHIKYSYIYMYIYECADICIYGKAPLFHLLKIKGLYYVNSLNFPFLSQ